MSSSISYVDKLGVKIISFISVGDIDYNLRDFDRKILNVDIDEYNKLVSFCRKIMNNESLSDFHPIVESMLKIHDCIVCLSIANINMKDNSVYERRKFISFYRSLFKTIWNEQDLKSAIKEL